MDIDSYLKGKWYQNSKQSCGKGDSSVMLASGQKVITSGAKKENGGFSKNRFYLPKYRNN